MNIREISEILGINRNSVAKVLDILTAKEEVEVRVFGRSKVYCLAQNVPLSDLMKFSSNFIIILAHDLRIVQANDAFLHYLNLPKSGVLNARLTDIVTDLFLDPEIVPAIDSAIMGTENQREICVKTDRCSIWYKISFTPTRFQDLSRGAILILENITGKKETENALRESEEKFRSLAENSLAGIYLLQDEKFLYVNKKFSEIFGYTVEELLCDKGTHDLIIPEDWPVLDENLKKRLTGEIASNHYELRGITKQKKLTDLAIFSSGTLYRGKPAIVGTLLDITDRKRADLALAQSKNQLAEIISFLPDATFVIDKTGTVIAWNKATEEMTGVLANDIVGKGNYEYGLAFYRERRPITIDLVFNDCKETRDRYPVVRKKGDRYLSEIFIPHLRGGKGAYLWFIASPLYDTHGNITGAIESVRDITDKKEAERVLIQRNEELQVAYEQLKATEEELRKKKENVR
ncbi:PAS domain S-box protein [uncultured Methanoregula sp.]|uniref:PAS domain S-box protein n=1 Tax=uncultured Methanoregula sp. TaxID=1005933 RepID=UPI002AAA8EC8|nr:PAS domain S-box protein [uncultured Methanoregula sp.]